MDRRQLFQRGTARQRIAPVAGGDGVRLLGLARSVLRQHVVVFRARHGVRIEIAEGPRHVNDAADMPAIKGRRDAAAVLIVNV
jgi:hypothetical protein